MVKKPIVKVSSRELAYRTEHYHDIKVIKDRQIACTSCGNQVIVEAGKVFAHPLMGTLQCEKCRDHFNNIEFSSDEDHVDKYCRLCAHENNLYICGSVNCTLAFCKRCIKRNACLSLLDIEKNNWKCFVCEPKPLWELRAVCASIMDSITKKSKRALRRNVKIHCDSMSPDKRYQNNQIKKMQKTLKSICDESDEECDNDSTTDKKRFYYKSSGKGDNITDHVISKNKCQKRITLKKPILRKFFATAYSESLSESDIPKKTSLSKTTKVYKKKVSYKNESTSDTEFEAEQTILTTGRNQLQKRFNLSSSKSDINNLSSDELNKTKSSKISDKYMQKKNKYQAGTSSCLHTSNSEQSEHSEPFSRVKRYHTVVKYDKANTNKFSNCNKKSMQINSDFESDEENVETEKKKVKTISNRSNKKKSSIKQSANESDKKFTSQSLFKVDTDSSSGREFQKTKLISSNYNLLRKKHDKLVHIDSTKRNTISKEQCKYFKSYITEVLDELRQQCSIFELHAQHIENKCKRRPMYLEGVEKIIFKSKSAINKIITDFKSYEKNLVNFYKSFIPSIKDEEYESSEDETVLNKKRHKGKCDNEKCNDSRSEIVSDCDSEIFSGNDISPDITKLENSDCKEEISHSKDDNGLTSKSSKSVNSSNNIVEPVELRTSQSASPILGKQQVRKNLPKSVVGKSNVNNETCDVQNSDIRDNGSKNSMLENVIENNASLNDPENKNDEDEIPQSISSKLITAIPSSINSPVINTSLNDLFTSSFESENEINKFDTVTIDLNISSIQKEHDGKSNTKCSEPREDIVPSNDKEINLQREQEHDYAHIFEQKTQEICEPNKSNSDTEKITTENNSKKDSTSENVISSRENMIEIPKNKSSSQTDSDILNASTMPSDFVETNQLERSKDDKQTDIESDCSTIILNDLDKSGNITKDTSDNDTLDNTKQNDDTDHRSSKISSEKRSFCDTDSNEKIEELIRNALLESDSDDSTPSSSNKEIEVSRELFNTDSCKIKAAVSDNGSIKSDKSQRQMNDTKSSKSSTQKRNHDLESNLSVGSRVKRRRLQLQKNYYYMNDKKLRMICHVQVEKLQDKILHQYKQALKQSKEYQSDKKLKSLIDLDTLEKTNKRKKSVDSTLSNEDSKLSLKSLKSKKNTIIEEEDSLMDHLKKVQDGNTPLNMENASDNDTQNLNALMDRYSVTLTNDNLMLEADNNAKKLLLNSSDSNLDDDKEQQETMSYGKDKDASNDKDKSIKKKKIKKEVLESNNGELSEKDEEKELKNKKSKWRKDKILTMKLSDSDSEKEKEKWEKSQTKLAIKEEDSDEDIISIKKKSTENKRKKNNRIIDSDSDVKEINIDSSDSDLSNSTSDVQILSSSDNASDKKQKKKRKRKIVNKSSDTESSDTIKRPKLKRIKKISRDSSSDNDEITSPGKSNKPGRKNIRKVLKDKQVAEDTKQAAKEEEERLKRIMERQKLYNEMYETRLAGEEKVEKLVLDFNPDTKEELVSVNKDLVKRLKPHQAKGIKFMWDACFESLERIKTTSGSGCIIAHCMGLGKTLQVITLSHTLLTHEATGVKCILVVCPLSTVLNWTNEFSKWLKDVEDGDIDIYELTKCKKDFERKYKLQYWHKHGGVLIIGYEMFRTITGKRTMRKNMKEAILQCLVDPGPDLVVCDEGHLLKNEDTALSKCMKNIKTLRRIVLTGTPLQNNLIEYHCMVQFVKPNLLGTKKEFLNRFANPITNGQFDNSTEYDVKIMKKRAHVLHKLLQGSVQRFDYSVLTPFLPPKQEYVIFVRLTDVQIKLYQYYLDNFARRSGAKGALFTDYQALQRIWTHPLVLQLNAEKIEKANEKKRYVSDSEGSLANFVVSDEEETSSTSDSDSDVRSVHSETSISSKRKSRSNADEDNSESGSVEMVRDKEEWWSQFIETEHFNDIRISAKLVLLFGILKESEKIGDKVLVFSQSLYSLTLIEQFLAQIDEAAQKNEVLENLDGHTGSWTLGLDYFRLDGQTSAENRNFWCKIFNRPTNTRARLFLISTRAGGLGINLTAANRVIIFDASWNPSHDIQSIFRVYRFGQKKPCYIYRFLAAGTMEEKIYNRQVTKLSLSCRVVDEQQIERHYSHNALNELYKFEPLTNTDKPTLNLPKDRLLAEIFLKYKDLVENYHEHDSLLENKADEELNEEERKQAWLEYEQEKKGIPQLNPAMTPYQNNVLLQQYNMLANRSLQNIPLVNNANRANDYENLNKLIEKDYPNATPEQRRVLTIRTLTDMYNYWEQQAMIQSSRTPIIAQNIQQNVQQKNIPLVTTNVSTITNPNWIRQQLSQNPSLTYTTNSANTNIPNPSLQERIVNPYAYPKASTSNSQSRNEIPQVTIEAVSTQETAAKATTVSTTKEQEE